MTLNHKVTAALLGILGAIPLTFLGSGASSAEPANVGFDEPVATPVGAKIFVRNWGYGDAGWCTYHSRPKGASFDDVRIGFRLPSAGRYDVYVYGARPTGKHYIIGVDCTNAAPHSRETIY
ncbi:MULTISPECIES: hypothetical protein [Tsukamurella]|uniref:Uncharacterized protein n=2 Tax=Tsukamurella TaxID=2060 RepID=A0A846X406_9ACTN|nr:MULTISPECIES: hypothetical protein [Tsukamurella]KXP06707.1 hypothetical protein AXK60_11615 [Tsukamurella pseudospumae]NKY19831.1 hypothetical protein [Tsukamurella spumae]